MGGPQSALKSCLWLERPASWRPVAVLLIFALATVPAWPLVWQTLTKAEGPSLDESFIEATINSLLIAVLVGIVSFAIGWPLGTLAGLYEFPLRRLLLGLVSLPLLVPSFLLAIGWSALSARIPFDAAVWMAATPGCVVVLAASGVPLVLFATMVATSSLTSSQVDAARLAGGDRTVIHHSCRHAAPISAFAATMAAILRLSDPGPGQIFGLRTAASEILTSFASLFDFAVAGKQCLLLTFLVLVLTMPLSVIISPRLATEMLARQVTRRRFNLSRRAGVLTALALMSVAVVSTIAPTVGLTLPAFNLQHASRALREVLRTGANTLYYAIGTGLIAAALGVLLAFAVGRGRLLSRIAIACCLTLFTLPPALYALGCVQLAAGAPAGLDPLLRSRLTVCGDLAFRLFPVAGVLALRAYQAMPASWAYAAAVHGVPWPQYLLLVVLPHLTPAATMSILLVALLATADVGTVLLLHPPGEASLPLAIFTVMANAPESFVASLCLAYIALAAMVLMGVWFLANRFQL